MAQALLNKVNRIEALLLKIDAKIDNFLGFEELDREEKEEVEVLRKEVKSGKHVTFDAVFGD